MVQVLSLIHILIGTSAALAISDIPWNGPVGALKVGLVDGKLVFNPDSEQRKVSDLDVTVVSTRKKVVMIEAGANEVPNDKMFEAIKMAHEENQKIIALIDQMVSEVGKPKFEYPHADFNQELFDKIVADFMDEAKAAMDTDDKNIREARWNAMIEKWHEKYLEEYPDMDQYLEEFTYKFQKKIVKQWLLEGHRVDGRQKNEIRPLAAEVGVLPRTHGSGLFTRGQTQVLSVCTLDTLSANQKLDTIWEETEKRYMHHYNFPGYSVGEAKPARSPGRREIGHGALAERALVPVLPSVEEFPYAIRVVSEVLSSNGSTSQGSICGSTLALMDAGVPIKAPVAGISCGLIQDDNGGFTTFIDIQGVELSLIHISPVRSVSAAGSTIPWWVPIWLIPHSAPDAQASSQSLPLLRRFNSHPLSIRSPAPHLQIMIASRRKRNGTGKKKVAWTDVQATFFFCP